MTLPNGVTWRELVAGHEAGHAVVAWHYKLYIEEIRIGDLLASDGNHADGWVHVPLPGDRRRATGAVLLAGYAANVTQCGDNDLAWRCAQGDYADLKSSRSKVTQEAVQRHYDDARRILARRSHQWVRLTVRLLKADVITGREVATILGRRDPYRGS